MFKQNNFENVSDYKLAVHRQVTNNQHLERRIEKLSDRLSRIEQELLQWKAGVTLLRNNRTTNRLQEQSCNSHPLQNKAQSEENVHPLPPSLTLKVNQHTDQPKADQSEESHSIWTPITQTKNNVDGAGSKSHKCFSPFEKYFQDLFFNRYKKQHDPVLLSTRILFGILGFFPVIIEMMVYCNVGSNIKGLKFLFGSTFLFFEIAAMIYVSGAAIYGAVFEAWIFLILAIINCILAHFVWNCEDVLRKQATVYLIFKIILLVTCTELTHQNFCKFANYNNAVKASSRHILRQTLLFILTILALVAPGLKTVYQSVYLTSSGCSYEVSCGIIDLYEPKFNATDSCESGFVDYISAREELRILRNFIYFHIAFYSMFNKPFLEVAFHLTYAGLLRSLMLTGFFFLTVSYMWSNIDPFGFVKTPKLYIFDIVELALGVLLFIMLSIHCSKWHSKLKTPIQGISRLYCSKTDASRTSPVEPNSEPMVEYPVILYHFFDI